VPRFRVELVRLKRKEDKEVIFEILAVAMVDQAVCFRFLCRLRVSLHMWSIAMQLESLTGLITVNAKKTNVSREG
jgi:hypothetical protein